MRIAFYAGHHYWGGLSPNGGSRTIVKSASTLRKLGHHVDVVASADKYKWEKHPKVLKSVPECDAVIAVSASDVEGARKAHKNVWWWMRGIEKWQMPKDKLLHTASKVKMLVNAPHLQNWLKKHGIESTLVYAGMDEWSDMRLRGDRLTIGCLCNTKHKTKRWDLFRVLPHCVDADFVAFGAEKCDTTWLSTYLKNPTHQSLEALYSSCHIWFSWTQSEGFHNVPAEAAMCGCLLVTNNHSHNGMPYSNEKTAHVVAHLEDALQLIKSPDYSKVEKCQEWIKTNIGTRKQCMQKLITILGGTSD